MTAKIDPLGVIIAGGQSRRFQANFSDPTEPQDKFLAAFGDTTLLGHIIRRAQQQIPRVILNVNGDIRRVAAYGAPVISDDLTDAGPLGGIHAAMQYAHAEGHRHIITFSADSPFFPDDYVPRLTAAVAQQSGRGEKARIAICQSHQAGGGRLHPVMGIFAVSLARDLQDYIESGERRVMGWIRRQDHKKVVWDNHDPDPFLNINNRQDLAAAEKYL